MPVERQYTPQVPLIVKSEPQPYLMQETSTTSSKDNNNVISNADDEQRR